MAVVPDGSAIVARPRGPRWIREGQTLRQQTAFDDYLDRRAADPSYTFRRHLRRIGGAIAE